MNKWNPVILVACYLVMTTAAYAQQAFELAVGKASQGIDVLRLAWQQSWSGRWLESERGVLSGMHALSLNHWSDVAESVNVIAYSPVFVYHFNQAPVSYLKFGIGAAYLSDSRIKGRDLGSYFQFEDQFGIGWQQGRHDLGLVYMHYSNAGIEEPNHGIDMILLSYAYQMDF